jgi:hypothetical protein
MGKKLAGGFTEKVLAWRAPRLIPTGAGDLNGLAPAIIEALNRYMKSPPAELLEFGFPPVRPIRRGLHLLHQMVITIAPRVLGEWPWDIANLAEVRRAKFGLTARHGELGVLRPAPTHHAADADVVRRIQERHVGVAVRHQASDICRRARIAAEPVRAEQPQVATLADRTVFQPRGVNIVLRVGGVLFKVGAGGLAEMPGTSAGLAIANGAADRAPSPATTC